MAQLLVRNVPEEVVRALKQRAAAHGRSAEAEHRELLRALLGGGSDAPAREYLASAAQGNAESPWAPPRVAENSLPGYSVDMRKPTSRITTQGQVSIPAEVRRRLGVAAGSVLEWDPQGAAYLVRRLTRHSSEDLHQLAFDKTPARRELAQFKAGIRALMKRKHARR